MFKHHFTLLAILTLIFGGIYFWLVMPLPSGVEVGPRFDWPDEVANYFWTLQYINNGTLSVAEPLNLVAENQIHPRSFNVLDDGSLVPGSFLGLILFFAGLAKIFSPASIIYITPILSLLAVLAFYGIIKKIFDPQIALLSGILMLFHPAWWYYSVTSMLPNVAFISLFLISIYLIISGDKLKSFDVILSGFLLGLAVSIRPSEVIWLMVLYLTILVLCYKKIKISHLFLIAVVAVATFSPTLVQQDILYGDYFTTGYVPLQTTEISSGGCVVCQAAKSVVAPFGFHPNLIMSNLWTHLIDRLWWLALITLLGLVSFLASKKPDDKIFLYLIISLFVTGWLGVYYGSWQFDDTLTVNLNTLGLSYVRYFLPIFLLSLPFTALGLVWLSNFLPAKLRGAGIAVLLIILFLPSANLVLQAKPDSILPVKDRIVTYKQSAAKVMSVTSADSVIITVRKDKLFFPDRKVIHTFESLPQNSELIKLLPNLVKITDVYYYALAPEANLELNNNLRLEEVRQIGAEVLYKVVSK